MGVGRRRYPTILAAAVLVAILLAAQWVAAATAPPSDGAGTGRVLSRTGFAYLGGLRTFAAALLWNRLEPQYHEYYGDSKFVDLEFMVPSLRAVVALDPQFVQAYYVSSYLIFTNVGAEEGIDIGRKGVEDNPDSGILRANLAQLLIMGDKSANRAEALENVRRGLRSETVWTGEDEEFEGLAVMKGVLSTLKVTENAAGIEARLDELRAHGAFAGDHDHDADGKQDH